MKRYGQMTTEELLNEIEQLKEQMKSAEFSSQLAIIESKVYTAKSYLLAKEGFPPGLYRVVGSEAPLQLVYLNGVMAWGTQSGEEASYPIAMLTPIEGN